METFLASQVAGRGDPRDGSAAPSLTISRQYGSGTSRVGRALVEYLDSVDESAVNGWAFFDQSLIGKIIEDRKLPDFAPPFDPGKAKFPVPGSLEEILGLPSADWTIFNYSASTIRSLCHLGNAIVVGRAGNFLTSDLDNTFHVRLVGSEAKRIASTRSHFRISHEEAENLVHETDRSRSRFVRRFTGADVDAAEAYHLILNTDNLPDEVIVRIIGDSLVEWASEKSAAPIQIESLTPEYPESRVP